MTGWVLIFSLLILGGIVSTLGDRLGTKVGKARLSIFKLRPKSTAVLITVFTGSFISAISFAMMVAFNSDLRVGLFHLKGIKTRIIEGEKELKKLEKNLYALRSGDVVISSGQSLVTRTIRVENNEDVKKEIQSLLQKANLFAFNLSKTSQSKYGRILLVRKDHIEQLENVIGDNRTWVVSIRSAGNILRGEKYVYAFPEARLNKNIAKKGEVIAKMDVEISELDSEVITNKIKILLSSTLAEIKRRGSLSSELKINTNQISDLAKTLSTKEQGNFEIISKAMENSYSGDKVSISLELKSLDKSLKNYNQ